MGACVDDGAPGELKSCSARGGHLTKIGGWPSVSGRWPLVAKLRLHLVHLVPQLPFGKPQRETLFRVGSQGGGITQEREYPGAAFPTGRLGTKESLPTKTPDLAPRSLGKEARM